MKNAQYLHGKAIGEFKWSNKSDAEITNYVKR